MISFRNPRNFSTFAYWISLLFLVSLPFRTDNWVSWLPYILTVYMVGMITLSVGYHRLFCHSSFKTSNTWQAIFAVLGALYLYGSPIQWSVYHYVHHKYSDTDGDPHRPSLWALVLKSYKPVVLSAWTTKRLLKQNSKLHRFVDNYYLLILAVTIFVMSIISIDFVINAYLPGVALVLFVAGLHTILAHIGNSPKNLWFLEYILPAAGDWMHKTHHDHPGWKYLNTRWYHLDLGGILIKLIKK